MAVRVMVMSNLSLKRARSRFKMEIVSMRVTKLPVKKILIASQKL